MRVAVLGAGLQGTCTALELSRRGFDVDLVDQDDLPVNRASLRNEGKIHLGFVYAKDTSLDTARLMLDGALAFGPLMNAWTRGKFARVPRSRPFNYLVAPDSMVDRGRLEAHYAAVERLYHERLSADAAADYLGERPAELWGPLTGADRAGMGLADVTAAFRTAEVAVNPGALAQLLRDMVADDRHIRFRGENRVHAVERTATGFAISMSGPAGTGHLDSDQVVNALWDGRRVIDEAMAVDQGENRVLRLKYRVLVRLTETLAARSSVSIVLGPYGDVVVYHDATGYVSWYPECLQGWSERTSPPQEWSDACRGVVGEQEAAQIAEKSLAGADPFFPGLRHAVPFQVDAGVIVARGETDIADHASEFHRRTEIGVRSFDGYHTIDTGKLTTAPMFAARAGEAIAGAG